MTIEQTKEQLSFHYVGAIISKAGHKILPSGLPLGIDFSIRQVDSYLLKGSKRYLELGKIVDVQLKFTTEKQIARVVNSLGKPTIKYDLGIKNYNDLVYRRNFTKVQNMAPMILMVVVFKQAENDWLKLDILPEHLDFRLTFNAVAYWFYPTENHPLVEGTSHKRIEIPASNVVDFAFADNVFKIFKP